MNNFITSEYTELDIESINIIEEECEMYDIEVKDDHTFCITTSNIISHNCNTFIKAMTIPALKTDTSMIITNHIYDDPSAMYASKIKNASGGRGAGYMARLVIQCSKTYEKTEESKEDVKNYYAATILKFFTIKNALAKPFYESQMYLSFAKGPQKYFGLLIPAMEYGFITNETQGSYVVPSFDPEKKFKLKALLECDEAWNSFLPAFDEKSKVDMSYSSEEREALAELEESDEIEDVVDDTAVSVEKIQEELMGK
jgi:hypothetical protein